ncbi:hypothetical protein chiPu_0015272, partial [Chiloscyllium punctatum]|nr:hypothetical protein [Chiloscyllium punctatum]
LDSITEATPDEFEQQRPSRKQKSLGLLCQKFLARYPNHPVSSEKTEISLDEVATDLGVERRRIYDIVNVLESLQLVSRMAKNQYSWHGMLGLEQTLATLKRRGEQHGYARQLALAHHKELDSEEMEKGASAQERWSCSRELNREMQPVEVENKSALLNSRKDKSLRIMTEKFVMLFLVSEPKTVALDIAAKVLIEESQQDSADNSKFKNHSVTLSERTGSVESVFPVTVNTKERLGCPHLFSTQHRSHSNQFKAQSAPCSPAKFQKVRTTEGQEYSSEMVHLAATCRLQSEQEMKNSESDRKQDDGQLRSIPLTSYPLLVTGTAGSASCDVKTLTPNGASLPQTELSLPVCLSNGAVGQITPVYGTDEGCSYLLKNQPVVLLQSLSAAPMFMLYRNSDSTPGPSDSQTQQHKEISSFVTRDSETGSSTRHSKKRSPVDQCLLPPKPWKDDGPETKRGKILSCLEHASGSQPSMCLSSMDKPPTISGNLPPASFVLNAQSGLAERSQSCGSAQSLGVNELNLLLATNPNHSGITISPGHMGSVSLPYQMVMPVLCHPLIAQQSTGNSIPNNGLMQLNLQNLKLLPSGQLLMGSVSVPALSGDAVNSSPAWQIYSPVPTRTSREDHCNKPESLPQPPVAIKLHEESLNLITARDDPLSFVESYFHTPVPSAQGKRVHGVKVKAASPAQRRLEIDNNIVK